MTNETRCAHACSLYHKNASTQQQNSLTLKAMAAAEIPGKSEGCKASPDLRPMRRVFATCADRCTLRNTQSRGTSSSRFAFQMLNEYSC